MRLSILSLGCCLASTSATQNDYPIILMPGFLGWTRDELFNTMKYWGGFQGDLQEQLKAEGYEVYSVAGGPVSSSWDRVAEIYHQLKGGRVDYGATHSAKYGHLRYGESYDTALYPDWGTVDPATGKLRKVHLVSHSFGGMDCRLLVHLLNYGAPEETGGDVSELFKGGKDWVASCSSISSPHDGTSLTVLVNNYFPQVRDLILSIASVLGLDTDSHLYNFKLEQWGITRMPGESFAEFFDRVFHSGAWTAKKDISIWDLRPDGAAEFNDYVITAPHVYYFTYSTDATRTSLIDNKNAVATLDMIPILWPIANIMGFFDRVNTIDIPVNATWHANDGVVNTISMQGPTVGFNISRDVPEIIQVNTSTVIDTGIFYHMPVLSGWDHMAIIGVGLWKILPFYSELASMLASLPDHTSLEDKFRYSPKPFEKEYSAEGIYASKDASPCDTSSMFSKICEGTSPIMGERDCQVLKADIAKLNIPNDWCSSEKSVNTELLKIVVQYLRSASQ